MRALFKKIKQYTFSNKEGWGLTTDGNHIIMSDGSHKLTFRDPNDFSIIKTLSVKANHYAMEHLNELEYIKGYIYANIWPTNKVVKINSKNGYVEGKMDLTYFYEMALLKNSESKETNGMAYDSISNTMFITGKMWPEIYQIKLNEF